MFMKNKIMNKLRSNKGASITFGLLLFLVCAILCSVIIAAASANAGRLTKLADSEQKYFAVMSAAELLKDEFKKYPKVSIVEVKRTVTETVCTSSSQGTPTQKSLVNEVYLVPLTPTKTADQITEAADFTPANKVDDSSLVIDSIQKDAARRYYLSTVSSGLPFSRNLHVTPSLDTALTVDAAETIDTEGNITIILTNASGDTQTMVLMFGADRLITNRSETVSEASEPDSHGQYTVTTTTTEMTFTTLNWELGGKEQDI